MVTWLKCVNPLVLILSEIYQLESLARFLLIPICFLASILSVRDAEAGGSSRLTPTSQVIYEGLWLEEVQVLSPR